MKKISYQTVLRFLKEYSLMLLGAALYAFAWVSIIESADGIGGGASGLALLIQYAIGLPMGIGFFVINAILILLAMLIIGIKFGGKTIYCIIAISVSMSFLKEVLPPDILGLANDKLLSSILGGILSGVGVSLCFMQGGSTGGTDIVAMIINKYRAISYGKVVMMTDCTIIGCSWFIYRNNPDIANPLAMIIYGFVMVATFGYSVDLILAGNRQSSQFFIFSKNHFQEIAHRITSELGRGVTIIDGIGAYTQATSKMLFVGCYKTEMNRILRIIREIDPHAFISVGNVMGVYGQGFVKLENANSIIATDDEKAVKKPKKLKS